MSINIEKLYTNACDVLRYACIHLQGEKDGLTFYEKVTKDPELWLKSAYIGDVTSALEIWCMAKEEISKSKGGSAYTILKKFIKGIPDYRRDLCGAWIDADGRQCVCDGYRAVRLTVPVDGLKQAETPTPFDLAKVYPTEPQPTTLDLPSPAELRAYIADPNSKRTSDGRVLYDFGAGLPLVDAKWLKDMVDLLPGAVATCDGLTKPIVFKSERGDGLLLPVRKSAA